MPSSIESLLEAGGADLDENWSRLEAWLQMRFGKTPGLEGILFLIGIQERGTGYQAKLAKEVKQDTIMEGTCRALATMGFYMLVGTDSDGRQIWERTARSMPALTVEDQEKLLKIGILKYFENVHSDE
jgi:hypothetical protein